MKKDVKSFELHVALLMHAKGLKLGEARFQAWLAGPSGLQSLLPKSESVVSAFDGKAV